MKPVTFITMVAIAALASCKPTYKATDRPKPATDAVSSTADSMSSSTNKIPPAPDSTSVPSKIDSTKVLPATDSTSIPAKTDSTSISSKIDSTKIPSTNKKESTSGAVAVPVAAAVAVSVPAGTQTAFTAQYPGAENVVWANYDSLAAVPIDLRMAGWKKMDAEDHLVKFDMKDENYYAWYDSDGKWVGSAYTMKDLTKLPAPVNAAVKNAVKTKYAGYSITNVNKEFQKGKTAYEIELKKEDSKVKMLVNADGKITQVFKYVKEK